MKSSYKDTFKGTAWYYARYRAGYPDVFFEMLRNKFNLTGKDRLLDLGCGTGQIAIPIAQFVREVVAMDPEPEMLVEGKSQARKNKIKNIKWIEGSSEDLTEMSAVLGKFKLVTMGNAFHWMEREKTLGILYEMIKDGGGIVVAGVEGNLHNEPVIDQVIKKWLGQERRAGSGFYNQPYQRHEEVVGESKFQNMEYWEYKVTFVYNIDSVIGNIYSTSLASPYVLGDKREAFEKDLREVLMKQNPSGKLSIDGKIEAILAWK